MKKLVKMWYYKHMAKNKQYSDRDFQKLAAKVNQTLINNENLIGDQKTQVENVMALEVSFIDSIKKHTRGYETYDLFILFIIKDLGNILSARPYFRETGVDFTKNITPAIKGRNPKRLMDFQGNFMLIKFIVDNWGSPLPKKSDDIYQKLVLSRNILIENNIPLAINRAKLFYRKVPKSHLTLLDFINICTHGLINGIDKYNGPYTTVWRSVCIGRMTGHMMEEYSKSLLRMYPSDRKILYRANALKHKLKIDDINILTKALNESFKQDKIEGRATPKLPITKTYLHILMNSATPVSADANIESDDDGTGASHYDYLSNKLEAHNQNEVSDEVEKMDLMRKVSKSSSDLFLIEKKVIRLKGVDL
jgi:DNA-directed RNA polymerase specialized sigma subunit